MTQTEVIRKYCPDGSDMPVGELLAHMTREERERFRVGPSHLAHRVDECVALYDPRTAGGAL